MQTQQTDTQDIQTPLISFIVTTYNLPIKYLIECLKSILQLSLSPKEREIILIDDGSDISPIKELLDYQDDIVYLRQQNQGLSMARNQGLQIATGKFIQFVDGDDYLLPASYEYCLNLLRHHNPDIVHFHFTHDKTTANAAYKYTYTAPVSGSKYLYTNNLRAAAWSYIFRTSIQNGLRFTPGILHEDEEFTPLLFLQAKSVITTDAKAYFYRKREDSITHKSDDKRHNSKRLADLELVIFHLQEKANQLPETECVALRRRIAQLTMDYLYNTIVLTQSSRHLEDTIQRLYAKGLFPLPKKKYTKKYQLFCKAINSKIGRKLMVLTLPKLQ